MAINVANNIFSLETKNHQYAFGIGSNGILYHLHWGKKANIEDFEVKIWEEETSNHSKLELSQTEFSSFGSTIYRECALKCEFPDGTRDVLLKYDSYEMKKNTLKIVLKDEYYPLVVTLIYKVFEDVDIIERNATVTCNSKDKLKIEKAFSAEFNLPDREIYKIKNSNGTWGGENQIETTELKCGNLIFESRKGTTGHSNSPMFIAYKDSEKDEKQIFFSTLKYSGNFKVCASRDGFQRTRILIGINDFDFLCEISEDEEFTLPVAIFGFANSFDEMSNNMNEFAINNILPKSFAKKELPVLYNSWEATEFDVNIENQKHLADIAKEIGAELFVMDDGWFGERNKDNAGLGDWFANKDKFPNGISELADYVNSLQMDFGIWIEPEMVNKDSDLFRAHPDWIYHFDSRTPSELRNQLVLNLTKKEVKNFVYSAIDKLLSENNIKYIKWDMNRPFSEVGAENLNNQKMLWYLHTNAVYEIIDTLKDKHPNVQFEACASGGGRADYGAFSHFDEVWTSDNTDGADRIEIQNGFSLLNPTKAMRCWVTDWGNAPYDFRFNIAMQGALGLGMNLDRLTEEDKELCKNRVTLYKEIRSTVQFGKRYSLANLSINEINANQYVKGNSSVVFVATPKTKYLHKHFTVKLKGLNENSRYRIIINEKEMIEKSGSFLMNVGIERIISGIYKSEIWIISKL